MYVCTQLCFLSVNKIYADINTYPRNILIVLYARCVEIIFFGAYVYKLRLHEQAQLEK